MTNIQSIVTHQQPDCLYLHKEGSFWRAYEQSACHFVRHIKPYRILKRYFKVVQQDITYLGFPLQSLALHLATACSKGFTIAEQTDTLVCLHGFTPPADFEQWKQQQPLNSPAPHRGGNPPPPAHTECPACAARRDAADASTLVTLALPTGLYEQLRTLDLAQINFNQCLIFLHNLKTLFV